MADLRLRQRQNQARGDGVIEAQSFGTLSLEHMNAGPPTPAAKGHLKDHERGARPPIQGSQAQPDHGPHR
jgi:hypothetical protein